MSAEPADAVLVDTVIDRFFVDHPIVAAQKLDRIDRQHAIEI